MSRRSVTYETDLAERLRDPHYARGLLETAMKEGPHLHHVPGTMIRAIGVAKFAAAARMTPPSVLQAIDRRRNPPQETLDRLLKPFGLRLGLAPLVPDKAKRRRGRLGKDGTRS